MPNDIRFDGDETKCNAYRYAKKLPRRLDQEDLVSKAQSGDEVALWLLVETHLHQIYLTAARITRNHEDAVDASQECLVKAFTCIQAFRSEAKFSTWLTRIAINESLMLVRKRKAESRHVFAEKDLSEIPSIIRIQDRKSSSDPEAICTKREKSEFIREAVGQLGLKSKLAIHLFTAGEMRTREIASALQLSHSGAKTRLRRELRKLRAILTQTLGNGDERVRGWIWDPSCLAGQKQF